jgi:hypothetical protein
MHPAVTSVVVQGEGVLRVTFDDGEAGTLDMTGMLDKGVFTRLKDPAAFAKVRVAFDTVEWECGVDLDPEFVYERCMESASATDATHP